MKPLDLLSWKQKSGFEININVRSKKKKSLYHSPILASVKVFCLHLSVSFLEH